MIPEDWFPHRRADDRELLGWIRPEGDQWVAVSLFGAEVSGAVEWLEAEEALETIGLSWLADLWMLEREDGEPLRVRIVDVSPDDPVTGRDGRVVVKTDDFGAIDVPYTIHELPWPPPATLRPARRGEGSSPWG